MLGRNLWQEESALRVIDDQEAMAADLNVLRKNWLQGGEQRNLDAHLLELGLFHRIEARIFQGSAHSAADDCLAQGFVWFGNSNASLQAPAHMNRDENATRLGKHSVARYDLKNLTVHDSFANSLMG